MISRVYVTPKVLDNRARLYLKSWAELGLSGKISGLKLADTYTLIHDLGELELNKIAQALTNPILERYSVDQLPEKVFDFALEIGFLPGVTDNVAHTVKETITDLLRLKGNSKLEVYTSKVFLISGSLSKTDVEQIAATLYNPLIESGKVILKTEIKNNTIAPVIPEVKLNEHELVSNVSLSVTDQELIKIGREGILDKSGRRGPLALDLSSMKVIKEFFTKEKRDPTDIELESLAQTWSEHCKHTIFANPIDDIKEGLYKTYIKGATNEIRKKMGKDDFCVSVFSDNAGGIVFDDQYLITHKVETHNTPSALDPFGGAITGIGGVNRDAIGFGLGAKPVANTYGFCFGEPEDQRPLYLDKDKKQKMFLPKRIMEGVIRGINVGGNTSGIPTISGFLKFDNRFKGKPLVFAGTIGLIPRQINGHLSHEKGAQPRDYIVVVGGRVGKDGIHGATFSSVVMDNNSPVAAVQIGDPITQKKLSDAIVKEARDMGLYTSITDNGAGGISCSVAEMAKECNGAAVDLEKVPLKYLGLSPWEIWVSESQERMTLSVPKENWEKFRTIMESRGVEATVIGEFTDSGKCVVNWQGKEIMNLPLEFLHNGLPKHNLKTEKFIEQFVEPKLPEGNSRTSILEELLSQKNLSGTAFVSEQYDHEVQASSVLKPLSGKGRINTDGQVFRPVLNSKKGAVLSSGVYPSYGDISPYDMAACAVDTAIRNNLCAGGRLSHMAILDNFCWCSSNDPQRLGQLVDAVKACYDYAVGYGTPFISGKDSMFNDFHGYDETGKKIDISIPPTILISALSVSSDLNKTVSPEFKNSGDSIYLLGETNDELGGSEYFTYLAKKENNNATGSSVPKVNVEKNLKTYTALEQAIEKSLINSAISVNSGGLAAALARACIGGMLGAKISFKDLPGKASNIDAKLFSESQGRILVSVSLKNKSAFEKMLKGVPCIRLGSTDKNGKIRVTDGGKEKIIDTNVKKLYQAYHSFSESMK